MSKSRTVRDPLDKHVTRLECQAICVAVIHRMMTEIAETAPTDTIPEPT